MEVGVAAIPPSEFYTEGNKWMAQDYLRFAVCQTDAKLEVAKGRLRGLGAWMEGGEGCDWGGEGEGRGVRGDE